MYIERLTIENFRCFDKVELSLIHPLQTNTQPLRLPNVTLLLGNNGTGKSAVLKAIALACLNTIAQSAGVDPYFFVRRTKRANDSQFANITSELQLHLQDLEQATHTNNSLSISKQAKSVTIIQREGSYESIPVTMQHPEDYWKLLLKNDESPAFFSLGYGVGRRAQIGEFSPSERERYRRWRYQRVASLFENHYDLIPPYAWLNQTRRNGRIEESVTILQELLPEGVTVDIEGDDAPMFRRTQGAALPYLTLSDGFRGYIGWVMDLLYHMDRVTPVGKKLADLTGIVMVDEIDLFLHPEWQRVVIPTVARALPNLQFVFTTHSPIVAGTLESENVWVTEWDDETGSAQVRQPEESIFGMSADQILTSTYFGLKTTRAPEAENELDLLADQVMKGDREAGYEYLERLALGFEESK